MDFPDAPLAKNPPAHEGDVGLIPGLGRFHMLLAITKESPYAVTKI